MRAQRGIRDMMHAITQIVNLSWIVVLLLPGTAMADHAGHFPGVGSKVDWERAGAISDQATRMKDTKQAMKMFQEAIKIYPYESVFWYDLGLCYKKNKDYKNAEANYKRALELDPNFISALMNLGYVLHKQNKAKEALTVYKRVINIDPKNIDAWYAVGNEFFDLCLYNDSENAYKKALSLDKNYFGARINLGDLYCRLHRYREAQECFLYCENLSEGKESDVRAILDSHLKEIHERLSRSKLSGTP